ncbi:MAG: dCTP deaminase, partial [Rhabdochlamydiaceae bacterium]
HKAKLKDSLADTKEDSLFIEPLLDGTQIGAVALDLRLGYDFLVSIVTRQPSISLRPFPAKHRGIASHFQETRRDLGDRFILYPNQVVLTTTLEFVSMPPRMYADILSRSSYTRLGIHVNTMVQPGFRGCVPLELFNHGNNAVELVVGSRICQARFFEIDEAQHYANTGGPRKYYGDVRPTVSKADRDPDLQKLYSINESSKQPPE